MGSSDCVSGEQFKMQKLKNFFFQLTKTVHKTPT